jgi:hypothetical protein
MSILRTLLAPPPRVQSLPPPEKAVDAFTIEQIAAVMRAGGYQFHQTLTGDKEEINADFVGMVYGALLANPVISGALRVRMEVFSQARFQFRRLRNGKPGGLFPGPDLQLLENPEPMQNTSNLLSRALMDADLAANWFALRRSGPRIKRLRPDWCWLVFGSPNLDATPAWDPDAEVIGLIYQPGGKYSSEQPQAFAVGEFAHWAPLPHPMANRIGFPWLLSVLKEIEADQQMTVHKLMFLVNGATPNLIIKTPPGLAKEKAQEWIELFEQEHSGAFNAYRTAYLSAGFEIEAVGKDLTQIDFARVQGKGETRMAVAARVPPTLLYISEGLQGSSLNAGNYQTAKRAFADTHLRYLWASISSALEALVPPPSDAELWYDETLIPFLQDDAKDASEIKQNNATTMGQLVRDGWTAASAARFIETGDPNDLEHTGLLSVQLQEPGSDPDSPSQPNAPVALAGEIRCAHDRNGRPCGTLLAELASAPYRFTCRSCKAVTEAA